MKSIRAIVAAAASVVALLVLLALFGVSPRDALAILFRGAAGDAAAASETLLKAVPLLMTGLAVLIAFRAGVWNIGGEGQFIAGALAALAATAALPPGALAAVIALVAGFAGGAAWGGIAALLRIRRNVPEVLSTILLNFVALSLLGWAVNGPLQERSRQYPQSDAIPIESTLPALGLLRLHAGIVIAVAASIVCALVLWRTEWGLRLRATGANPAAASYAGVPVKRFVVQAMLISGGLAGAGGAIELLGVTHRLYEKFAAGYGYSGITAALLGGIDPLGALAASLFLAALRTGSGELQRAADVSSSVAVLAEGIVVIAILAFAALPVHGFISRRGQREDEP